MKGKLRSVCLSSFASSPSPKRETSGFRTRTPVLLHVRAHRESLPPLFPAEGMGLLAGGGALPYPTPHVATAQRATTLRTKDEGDNEGGEKALLPLPIVLSQSEDIADTPSPLQSPLHFLKTTKEI